MNQFECPLYNISNARQTLIGLGLGGSGNIYLRVMERALVGCHPELVALDHGPAPPPPRVFKFTQALPYS